MKNIGSRIADEIMNDYYKEKYYKALSSKKKTDKECKEVCTENERTRE